MSRSNTNYYNLCPWWKEIGEDGYCDYHRRREARHKCTPPREYATRRGVVVRKPRFPDWTWKRFCSGPSREIKQLWNGTIRARHRTELSRNPEDPDLFDSGRWLSGQYGSWS